MSAPPRLSLPLRRQGRPVDFNFCDFDMIVTPAALNVRLGALVGAAIQRIPVAVEGTAGVFEILNVCAQVRCIDEARSAATQWTSADGRPDKTGEFRMITKLRISAGAARGHQIFRAAGWPVALIVSGQVKALLESEAISGVRFERVD